MPMAPSPMDDGMVGVAGKSAPSNTAFPGASELLESNSASGVFPVA